MAIKKKIGCFVPFSWCVYVSGGESVIITADMKMLTGSLYKLTATVPYKTHLLSSLYMHTHDALLGLNNNFHLLKTFKDENKI